MKLKIAVIALALALLSSDGVAATIETSTGHDSGDVEMQDFRLPGAPSGGYRGDYRFKVRGKRTSKKKASNRRPRVIKKQAVKRNMRDDG